MKNRIFKILAFLGIGFLTIQPVKAIQQVDSTYVFNVLKYGVVGDGKTDNSLAFIKCFTQAVKFHNSVVIIPYGKYKISKPIDFYFTDQNLEIEGLLKDGKQPVVYSDNYISMLSIRGYAFRELSKGSVSLRDVKFSGKKISFSNVNPFINKNQFFVGIHIADKSVVSITNVVVENIYGQGIQIVNTDNNIPEKGRFLNVSIKKCKVLNCWGYNPKADNYGDGIYLSNCQSGSIVDNVVSNDIAKTRQFGRGGIVLEYFADNILIQNNTVVGYDRALHVEETSGGQRILGNSFLGTDLGIVIYETGSCQNRLPIVIKDNLISNKNFNKSSNIKRIRMPRAMLNFLIKNNCSINSVIEGNTFVIDKNFQFLGHSMANLLANNLILRNNKFIVKNASLDNVKILINDEAEGTSFINNIFDGTSLKKKFNVNSAILISQNSFLEGGTIL